MDDNTLNSDLARAFRGGISTFCYFDGARGDSVDNMIVNAVRRYCPYLFVVELAAWKELRLQAQYRPIKDKVQEIARGGSCDCLDLVFTRYYDRPTLIRQPNNTQQWPDFLVVYKQRGIGIEVKSSKQDQIVWNSGLPRMNGIYIYNGGLATQDNIPNTTYFLGQHVLTVMEQKLLSDAREASHKISHLYNDLLNTSRWSLYARPMFNYAGRFLANEGRVQRETDVQNFIESFSWE